ncbi:MAG: hypothetical protein ACXWT1_02940 [Methylobacter sp.]
MRLTAQTSASQPENGNTEAATTDNQLLTDRISQNFTAIQTEASPEKHNALSG